jgi:TetR/AcrR family transcriptional regulator, transcriptional repressor for nem operon
VRYAAAGFHPAHLIETIGMPASSTNSGTSQKILDVAERLLQVRGYNGFSYADIAAALRITKASLHYHFPSKSDLGRRLMERYTENFVGALAEIDASAAGAREKLERYIAIYSSVLADHRMCLCGMLAAEYATLPKPIRAEVLRFFDANEIWLARVLEQGRESKLLRFAGPAVEAARALVAGLEGAMMMARSYGDAERFARTGQRLLAELT